MTDELFRFLERSPTPLHAATNICAELQQAGFTRVSLDQRFPDPLPERLFARSGGAVFALDTRGTLRESGVTILAAHTDSPSLKLKVYGIGEKKGVILGPTEVYGGPIRSTWLDQPLGVAGRVYTHERTGAEFQLDRRVVIPNLAIHLNRSVNEGYEYNPQEHLTAILGQGDSGADGNRRAADVFADAVARAAGVEPNEIAEIDAYLFDPSVPQRIGLDGEFFLSPRIDNLSGCFTNLRAFLASGGTRPCMLALYNHEEIGSRSAEGALSGIVGSILDRAVRTLGYDDEDREVITQRSFLVSNDATHAMHPNFTGKYDEHYSCSLNGGPVIKYSASHRYATTGESAAKFQIACRRAGVPVQRFVTRSDMRSGSTVGPLGWAQTGIASLDIGLPIWAMHSIRETAGGKDVELMTRALAALLGRE